MMPGSYVAHGKKHDVPLGVSLWRGLDRAAYILPPGDYPIDFAVSVDERQEWGLLRVGLPGEWYFQSRCGRIVGSPLWWLDDRPGYAAPKVRRGPPYSEENAV
jgi:hypothetical protein